MPNANALRNIGLRGVTVADTGISQVDGIHGKILIRGFSIQDLAKMASYEETAYILLYERAPNLQEFHEFMDKLDQHRSLTDYELQILRSLPHETTTMQVLQGMVALLAGDDIKSVEETKDALVIGYYEGREGTKLEGSFGGFWVELKNGKKMKVGGSYKNSLTDEKRKHYWAIRDTLVGMTIEYIAQTETSEKVVTKKARFGRFVRIREDMS